MSGLPPPPANPTAPFQSDSPSDQIIDTVSTSPETSPSPPARSPSSGRRLSRFNLFRRNSKPGMNPPASSNSTSPAADVNNPPNIKPPDNNPEARTLSPQARPRNRTPSASPYGSPRTSIYGALSSPSSGSNPADIFERSIESVPSVSTQSPSIKGFPTHQVLEDIIPPALEATATTFTDHVNPDDVEIVTFCEVQSSDGRSNAGSPIPSSPVISVPVEVTQNHPEHEVTTTTGSSDSEGKGKWTLNLMSAVDHLAEEIIHPTAPAPVEKKPHVVSPLSLSPTMSPSDVSGVRTAMADMSMHMERSQSQASTIGDVVIVKQNMGDALRHQKLHGATLSSGDISPTTRSSVVSPSPEAG